MRMQFKTAVLAACAGFVCAFGAAEDTAKPDPAPTGMTQPKYDGEGKLIKPEGYRNWVFVGSSLGLDYSKPIEGQYKEGTFHHVYMQPEAVKHYQETGRFPDKTMLVMENYSAGTKDSDTATELTQGKEEFANLNGQFSDEKTGLEAAVKDSEKSTDIWSYYAFGSKAGELPAAKAFPKQTCWDCHNKHAAVDNVFLQFYPILREARATK
jgi:hypothetical protein